MVAAEMKFLRRTINKTRKDRIRNTQVREETGRRSVTEYIEEKQLKWYGHVKRMGMERIVRKNRSKRVGEKN